MKIIGKSNFDIETVDDILLCENVLSLGYGTEICNALNTESGEYFFKVVPDDYKLYKFEY